MPENPLKVFESLDPALLNALEGDRELAFGEGAMPVKYKYLVAMALDASHGAVGGVASLARSAVDAGATKQEVAEALRVAWFVTGAGSVYTAGNALAGMF